MLDGDRRWARGAGHNPAEAHRVGNAKICDLLRWCNAADVEHVTLWALSDDNLHRPPAELGPLLVVIEQTVASLCAADEDWRIGIVGSLDLLPGPTARSLKDAVSRTTDRTGLRVDVAIGYGGRHAVADAVRTAFDKHVSSGGDPRELAETFDFRHICDNLRSPAGHDIDLVIRTFAEQGLSESMLWQSARDEAYVVDVLWPGFRRMDLLRALRSYAARDRRGA